LAFASLALLVACGAEPPPAEPGDPSLSIADAASSRTGTGGVTSTTGAMGGTGGAITGMGGSGGLGTGGTGGAGAPSTPKPTPAQGGKAGSVDAPSAGSSPDAARAVDVPASAQRDGEQQSRGPAPDARTLADAKPANGMVLTYTLPDGSKAVLPICPHGAEKSETGPTCVCYCSFWFDKNHCTAWPATKDTYASVDDCMGKCNAFVAAKGAKALSCHQYRTDNNDFHCPKGVLGAKCP
jgi:hypothetical protein